MTYSRTFQDLVYLPSNRDSTWSGASFRQGQLVSLPGTRSGEKVDRWREKIKASQEASSDYTSDRRGVKRSDSGDIRTRLETLSLPKVKYHEEFVGFASPMVSVNHLAINGTAVNNKALMLILKRIRERRSQMNGQSFVGELGQTIKMLKHPFSTAHDLIFSQSDALSKRKRGLRGTRSQKRKGWLDAIADTWLETSFGLKPLIKDTEEISKAIFRIIENGPKRARARARAGDSNAEKTADTGFAAGGLLMVFRKDTVVETTYSRQYVVGFLQSETANVAALERARETFGFTLENFVPALYEVMPWSWLLDYFSNLGDIITAGTTNLDQVLWAVRTDRTETFAQARCSLDELRTVAYIKASGLGLESVLGRSLGENELVRRTVVRTRGIQLGVPDFQLSFPGKLGQYANLGAVLLQRRKKLESYSGLW